MNLAAGHDCGKPVALGTRRGSQFGSQELAGRYRSDIDGLRAIAVLLVLSFHAFPNAVPGGFVGVDVFFVISGFLISSIIFDELDESRFSFPLFYARRITRIFPALIVVIATCLVLGWLFLSPSLYENLGREAVAGALFGANFLFWRETGYFDSAAVSKPLLHLWSLGVEEQFYLIWPAALYLCRRARWNTLFLIVAVAAASLALYWHEVKISPDEAFYLPQARFWELMFGALLAHSSLRAISEQISSRCASAMSWSGAIMILIAAYYVNNVVAGLGLLLPTIGAALIISANSSLLNVIILSRAPMVFVGKISYPLYLWHWPLLYFYRLMPPGSQSAAGAMATLCLSLALAVLTHFLIERPLQRVKVHRIGLRTSSVAAACAMIAIAAFSAEVVRHDGFEKVRSVLNLFPLPPEQIKLMKVLELNNNYGFAKLYGGWPCMRYKQSQTIAMFIEEGCLDRQFPDRPDVFLLGDSHAGALAIGLVPLLASRRINLERMTYGWCKPADDSRDPICDELNAAALAKISELKPDLLIVDAWWVQASRASHSNDYAMTLLSFLSDMLARGAKHIVVVGEIPTYYHSLPERLIEDYISKSMPLPQRVKSAEAVSIEMDARMRGLPYPAGVEYLSLRDALCNADGCLAFVGPDVEADILLWDYGHLTANGSKFVSRTVLEPVISRLLPQSGMATSAKAPF